MIDFTKQIPLEKNIYKTYRKLQMLLYFFAFLLSAYIAYLILFPSAYFSFDFSSPNSEKNSITYPKDSQGQFADHGKVSINEKMIFDTALSGKYEKAKMQLIMDEQSENPSGFEIQAKKSYQAFLYPDGDNLNFKDGTLLSYNKIYYIASNGKLRNFSDEKIVDKMGYNLSAFISASETDLKYNQIGDPITESSSYPDNTIFKIDGDYYMLYSEKLRKFISQNVYLSQYNEDISVSKDKSLLEKYPQEESQIGFSDGTLLGYGISAFIVSSGKLLPVNNAVTFITMGYSWDDIKQASTDEISFYEKDKLFNINDAHPNGTILYAKDVGKNYMIENGKRRPIPTDAILKSWQKNKPVLVSSKSLNTIENCYLKKEVLASRAYSCDVTLEKINIFLSNNYEFYLNSGQEIEIDFINVTFKKQVSWENFRSTVSDIINRVKINYGIKTDAQ